MFGFAASKTSDPAGTAGRLARALTASALAPSPIPLPLRALVSVLQQPVSNALRQASPPPRAMPNLPPTLSAYQPTLRDNAASWMLDRTGNSATAQRLVSGLMGSMGTGQTRPGVVDFIPGVGQAFQSQEAGRQIGSGHPVAGLANLAMAALPIPGVAKVAKGLMGSSARTVLEGAAQTAERAAPQIVAYHGSPHTFDAFDAAKIGTGEGAQAYGHGLYFAENERVAQGYRDKIADNKMIPPDTLAQYFTPGRVVNGYGGQDRVVGFRPGPEDNPWGWSVDVIRSDKAGNPLPGERVRNHSTQPSVAEVNSALGSGTVGSMYQVGIDASPDHFLDWDKPLSEQHPAVRQAVEPLLDPMARAYGSGPLTTQSMGEIYRRIEGQSGAPDVAQQLSDAGVPGIKYFDWGSRGTGQGTRNYVVFDPKNIDILKRYGIPVGVAGGGMGAAIGAPPQDGQSQPPAAPSYFGFAPPRTP